MQTARDCTYLYGDGNGCKLPATVEIVANTGHPEDITDACDDHIGRLLGTITNHEWGTFTFTVIPLDVTDLGRLMTNHADARYVYASPTGGPGPRADLHGHPNVGVVHEHQHDGPHDPPM